MKPASLQVSEHPGAVQHATWLSLLGSRLEPRVTSFRTFCRLRQMRVVTATTCDARFENIRLFRSSAASCLLLHCFCLGADYEGVHLATVFKTAQHGAQSWTSKHMCTGIFCTGEPR
jgi:hypothetical protein